MRKRLRNGGIIDVEGIVEADAARLVAIVGDRSTAAKLVEMARRVLASRPPRPPRKASASGKAAAAKKVAPKKPPARK